MEFSLFNGFGGAMFSIVPFIILIVFCFVIGVIVSMLIKNAGQRKRNNNSPTLSVEARVVTKRANISGHHHHHGARVDDMGYNTSSTNYYATFEVESGDRLELRVHGAEYGMLAEGDAGKLTFQGTRYIGFERSR